MPEQSDGTVRVRRLPDDRLTGILPRAFTYGLTGAVLAAQAGVTTVEALRARWDAARYWWENSRG